MQAVKETIGDATVLIQVMDDDLDVVNDDQQGSNLVNTGIGDDIQNAYAAAKSVIKNIAEDLGRELRELSKDTRPKQMEIEFNMGLSAEAKAWILGAKSDCGLKIKMVWEAEK